MIDPESKIPEQAVKDLEALRSLQGQYSDISRRMGTHGERGLYHKYKSIIRQINKAIDNFNTKYGPEFTVVKSVNWPFWFIRVNEEI